MATSENPSTSGIAMKAYFEGMIRVGDLTIRPGHKLEFKDGLPEIVSSDPEAGVASDANCQQRLTQIIRILESPDGPQSTAWKAACLKLRWLKSHASNVADTNIKAWEIVMDAHNSTKKDLNYLKDILKRDPNETRFVYRASKFPSRDRFFPEHVCRLVGIYTPEQSSPNSWENILEEKMVRENEEIHSLVDATWVTIKKTQKGLCTRKNLYTIQKHVRRILELDQFKTFGQILGKKPFVMLRIKAKSARKLRCSETYTAYTSSDSSSDSSSDGPED
ncbi:hypothetical protein NM208_g3862 [Fusarium decemcellulare]|uniref:Uncharacterized protein n=1 Tax=Fusarium decemcellulare TaxID=57161 RepID=A0ACC1SMS1_9HYPO|nr:hypothetical protein NM208_g3862 [Fusarium decemcellulare]